EVFLEAALPGCKVKLEPISEPVLPDFRPTFNLGYSYLGGEHAITMGGGVDIGIPLTRDRETELIFGPRFQFMQQQAGAHREAFLAGVQAGLEHRPFAGDWTPTVGVFAGTGAYHESQRDKPAWTESYLEGGGSVGFSTPYVGMMFSGKAELAGGNAFVKDKEDVKWFRAGVSAVLEF
ncbi:MAG: hypothetical protein ACLGH0_08345, partial [Thermoanaerobaculia bacterium]